MQHKQNKCNCVCVCAWDHYLFRLIFHFHFFMWSTLCSCMKSAIQKKLLLLSYLKLIHTSDMSHCNEERNRERCYIMLVWPPWWHQKVQNPTTTVSAWQLRYTFRCHCCCSSCCARGAGCVTAGWRLYFLLLGCVYLQTKKCVLLLCLINFSIPRTVGQP